MTRKEQVKILDDKIKANKRQYDLDRINAEISAYSSGDLPKYEYLTKQDLNYKPNAFEQARFEYSPLGKVFTDELDKSDKKEGLLKRLKNIEDKNNNQLLALRNIYRPAIRGRNNGNNDDDDDDGDDDDDDDDNYKRYKEIESRKKEYKNKGNLAPYVDEEFRDIVRRSENLEGKTYIIGKNRSLYARKFENDYEKIINDFVNNGEKTYNDINNQLDEVNKGIEIYEKKKKSYTNNADIKDQINNSKKFAEGLKKLLLVLKKKNSH